jgi:hypothetical protein
MLTVLASMTAREWTIYLGMLALVLMLLVGFLVAIRRIQRIGKEARQKCILQDQCPNFVSQSQQTGRPTETD